MGKPITIDYSNALSVATPGQGQGDNQAAPRITARAAFLNDIQVRFYGNHPNRLMSEKILMELLKEIVAGAKAFKEKHGGWPAAVKLYGSIDKNRNTQRDGTKGQFHLQVRDARLVGFLSQAEIETRDPDAEIKFLANVEATAVALGPDATVKDRNVTNMSWRTNGGLTFADQGPPKHEGGAAGLQTAGELMGLEGWAPSKPVPVVAGKPAKEETK
jgi:hypothetical protein